ncbi:MAG: SAM-dependent methyltransferase [Muribaculaceae bacterium]|nr:SAM-dependent methyltransferase [Muribaculaceae bacterium]
MILRPALYMIPVGISDAPLDDVIPAGNIDIIRGISHFIVENVRTARRFLKRCDKNIDIDALTFYELNGHTQELNIASFLEPLRSGLPVGMMSEAGCPGVADPGAQVAAIAQREGFRVVPLAGPSSILMSLMASGFNGQGFAFNGYLPIENDKRIKALKELENRAYRLSQTQIFIETPYRNAKFFEFLTAHLRPETLLCVASQITDPEAESIITRSVAQWKKHPAQLTKMPAIFLISKP